MRQKPTQEEELKNAAIFLCLADRLSQDGVIGDRLKIQKCTFLVALDWFQNKLKGFNLTFFRYTWGPFSKHIYDIVHMLENAGLVESEIPNDSETGGVLRLTDAGRSFAAEFGAEVWANPDNRVFEQTIVNVGDKFRSLGTPAVINYVYDLEVTPIDGKKKRIKDMEDGLDITRVLDSKEAAQEIAIPQGWLETLAIMVSPENVRGIEKAKEDLASGKVKSHAEVWASV